MSSKAIRAVLTIVLLLANIGFARAMEVFDVRIGTHPDKTRLVLELTEKVPYRIFTLPDPYRMVIDLPQVEWKIGTKVPNRKSGVISSYRFGLFQKGNSRLVVDMRSPAQVIRHVMLPPSGKNRHRLVIDLKSVSSAMFQRSERRFVSRDWVDPKPQAAVVRPAVLPPKRPGRKGYRAHKRVVVIDPGHGGVDPGAIGITGLHEKIVTLRTAKTVKRALEKSGRYKVYMTRDEDVFVPLRQRFQLAERVNAELFVSLHADSHRDKRLRGVSIYTLSERASDREAAALAAKENRSDAIAGIDLSNQSDAVASFLIELRQRQTMNESAIFSEVLIKEVGKTARLLRNTHRFAGFAVLKSPDVPSILMELGYLSNRQDERMLRTREYQTRIGQAILRAADRYFERKERLSRS